MSKIIKIKKGFDILLEGVAETKASSTTEALMYALVPDQFMGITPKLLVQAGDKVKRGTALFFSKENAEILFTSPVAGTVREVIRGEKRKILSVMIEPDGTDQAVEFGAIGASDSKDEIRTKLLNSGLWPSIISRPFGLIASPDITPRDIFISGLDTAPLAADLEFVAKDQLQNIAMGIEVLGKLTSGKVHLTVGTKNALQFPISGTKNTATHQISGPHPAGNVGTQIGAIAPINKGETVWTIGLQQVAMIGRLATNGKVDFEKTIALAGSMVTAPQYYKTISGAAIGSIVNSKLKEGTTRLINGNPLAGTTVASDGFVGYYNNEITTLPEGDKYEFLGWAMPRLGKLSLSKSYFSWLTPSKKYNLDTNINGGERAFVMNDIYGKVMPMDIYPVYLLKAVMAGDIEKMEQLGIYEVIEEDLALCEFVCPSKIEWQDTLRNGISKMIKEL